MDQVYSDLEEGEIVDSPPPPEYNVDRKKDLPQRYVTDSKTPPHKRKKVCRHKIRHHAKKLSKLKKTPDKNRSHSKLLHKSSHPHEKYKASDRYNNSGDLKRILPKNSGFSQTSLIAEIGSLKNVSLFEKLSTNLIKSKSEKIPFLEEGVKASENEFTNSEISNAKLLTNDVSSLSNNESTNSECVVVNANSNEHLIGFNENFVDVPNIELDKSDSKPFLIDLTSPEPEIICELSGDNDIRNVDNHLLNKEEESEDEEELRRIALATCAKRIALSESTNTSQNIDYTYAVPLPDLPFVNNAQISHECRNNPTIDNYEIVDMELDEEMWEPLEIAETSLIKKKSDSPENLFAIDTNPSENFQEKENTVSEMKIERNSDDEDFEANILRAELINSMYRKKLLQEDLNTQSNTTVHENQVHVMQQKKQSGNFQKSNLLFSYKRLKSAKHFLRRRSVNKLVNIKNTNNIIINKPPVVPVPEQVSKPAERLIITVNGESSDDSENSDEETNNNTVSENPVDSIEALISDCRQKSEINVKTKEKETETVPKAVACLSKAQQEEYNSLMKILAKKNQLPIAEGTASIKNGSAHSPLNDLKKLEDKLVVLRGALKDKKESMTALSEEVSSKKFLYMKAKLKTQHLKEQLVAAEKIRKSKLLDWSKTCDKLKSMKRSVSDLENKINEVRNLCSKLGSSIQGQSYKLPQLSLGKEQC